MENLIAQNMKYFVSDIILQCFVAVVVQFPHMPVLLWGSAPQPDYMFHDELLSEIPVMQPPPLTMMGDYGASWEM